MKELKVKADLDNLQIVFEYIHSVLDSHPDADIVSIAIELAVDEVFTNVASYAYPDGEPGDVVITASMTEDMDEMIITFKDWGIPFNPLDREDPDLDVPIEERRVGGLGIYMVKQYMDKVSYEYVDGTNNLTLQKGL